ncbi:hypothetical protein B0H13DRAFT_2083554 [Mycena leptocephala]|nr:hypothetical protein B0H13DRAFT_2083554 [Mycena leptocephala]
MFLCSSPARRFFQGRPPSTHPYLCPAAATVVPRHHPRWTCALRPDSSFHQLMQRPQCSLKVISHLACRARYRMTSAGARTDWNAMTSPSCRPRAQAAPSTFARQPGYCTRSSRALLGSLLRQLEPDARRIPLRHPLLMPSSAGLDVDTPSLSCTITGPALLAVFRFLPRYQRPRGYIMRASVICGG